MDKLKEKEKGDERLYFTKQDGILNIIWQWFNYRGASKRSN